MEAVQHIPIDDREAFKYALGATLVKNNAHWRAFETVFEVYFSLRGPEYRLLDGDETDLDEMWREMQEQMRQGEGRGADGGGAMDNLTPEEIAQLLMQALLNGDQAMMRAMARQAVQRFAGMEPGRPVGGTYYLYRTLRNLDLDGMLEKLMEATKEQVGGELTSLEERLEKEEYQRPHREVQGRGRSRDPAPAGRRPRRRGDGQDAAQAAAGRRRVHARLARRDAVAEEGAVPADPQARRPTHPQAPPRAQGPARLPQHRPPLAQLRRGAGRTEVQVPAARPSPS